MSIEKQYIQGSFKKKYNFEQRTKESSRVIEKYPDRIPVIVEQGKKTTDFPPLDKQKYLVPNDLTVGQFSYVIRKRIRLEPHKAMFLMIGSSSTIAATSQSMGDIYENHKDPDNFLYVSIVGESVFG